MYPIHSPSNEGYLKVSKKHEIFFATYGNPDGIPVIFLHGGPGAGCNDTFSRFFDLNHWYLVMFDQRGAMRSRPYACMEENTTQNHIEDIESLRKHLNISQWVVFGGSWGSVLAILYGQAHASACLGFILRGIFLGREQDYKHLFYKMGEQYPEAYKKFLSYFPVEERDDLIHACYRRIMDPNPEIHMGVARAINKFNSIGLFSPPNPKAIDMLLQNDQLILSMERAFCFYSKNQFFLEENQVLSHMNKIVHLPAIIVHGQKDAICLFEQAQLLHQSWKNSELQIIEEGGHSSEDPLIASALIKATDAFIASKFHSQNL
ncbi:MAG: Proline iminopeptidase [Chlamydiae bacterium]|nr:Proline iminopeptidase [Chlamydiota bacterium]